MFEIFLTVTLYLILNMCVFIHNMWTVMTMYTGTVNKISVGRCSALSTRILQMYSFKFYITHLS